MKVDTILKKETINQKRKIMLEPILKNRKKFVDKRFVDKKSN